MELPAEGALTFEQKRELSHIVRAVSPQTPFSQLFRVARTALELPAEGALTFEQKRELSYIVRFIVHADKVLADVNHKELVKEARQALGLPASGILIFAQKLRVSVGIHTVSVPARALAGARLRGAGRVAEQRALRPEHTPVQFMGALRALARNEDIKIMVDWGGAVTRRHSQRPYSPTW